jgi:Fe-S-cluster containining protein
MPGPCDSCHAGCCRSYHLFIQGYDALRLASALGVPVGEFATLVSFPESEVAASGSEYVPLRFTDREPGLRFLLGLKRQPSTLFPGSLRCIFLLEWLRDTPAQNRENHPGRNAIGRCGVYGIRPFICQNYPTAWHQTLPLAVIDNPRPIPDADPQGVHALCPEKWDPAHFGSSADEVFHRLAVQKQEQEFYNQLCRELNAQGIRSGEFLDALSDAYARRFRHASAFPPSKDGETRL